MCDFISILITQNASLLFVVNSYIHYLASVTVVEVQTTSIINIEISETRHHAIWTDRRVERVLLGK